MPVEPGRVDWRLVLELALFVPPVHAAMRLLGYRRVHRALSLLAPARGLAASPLPGDARLADEIRIAARRMRQWSLLPGSCLSRSLTLWWLMRWRGRETRLHIGTRRGNGDVLAHAWLTLAGLPLNAGPQVAQRYQDFGPHFGP